MRNDVIAVYKKNGEWAIDTFFDVLHKSGVSLSHSAAIQRFYMDRYPSLPVVITDNISHYTDKGITVVKMALSVGIDTFFVYFTVTCAGVVYCDEIAERCYGVPFVKIAKALDSIEIDNSDSITDDNKILFHMLVNDGIEEKVDW